MYEMSNIVNFLKFLEYLSACLHKSHCDIAIYVAVWAYGKVDNNDYKEGYVS